MILILLLVVLVLVSYYFSLPLIPYSCNIKFQVLCVRREKRLFLAYVTS